MSTVLTPSKSTSQEEAIRYMKIRRHRARTDLFFLMTDMLGYKDIDKDVHGPILDKLPQFHGGIDETDKKGFTYRPLRDIWSLEGLRKRLVLYPRGHLKTTIVTQAGIIQWILNYPDIRILLTTAVGELGQKVLGEIKAHFQFNDKFRFFFPDYCPTAKKVAEFGNKEEFIAPNRKKAGMRESTVTASSVGKTIAGQHYEVLACSDMVDKENVKTPGGIRDVIDHFRYMDPLLERHQVAPGSSLPNHGWITVEGTRYDFGDLYGTIIDAEEKAKEKEWLIIHGSAEKNPSTKESLWPARFPWDELKKMERNMGPRLYCFPGVTPVLMADWTERPIEQIRVGDKVIGYEFTNGRCRLVETEVYDTNNRYADVIEVETEGGQMIRCTPDHKWWNHRACKDGKTHKRQPYYPLKVGREIVRVYRCHNKPTRKEQQLFDWLGGIFDGEGSCSSSGTPSICQSTSNPEVCAEIEKVLDALEIPWSVWKGKNRDPEWADKWMYQLREARGTIVRLLTHAHMAKRQRFIDRNWKRNHHIGENGGRDRVKTIKPFGKMQVYNLGTRTGNYVAWGYATKNCAQMLNQPVPDSGGLASLADLEGIWIGRRVLAELMERKIVQDLHVTVDLASMEEEKQRGDYIVLTLAGFDRVGRMYVVDIRRAYFTELEVINQFYDLFQRYPGIVDFKVEKEAHWRTLKPFLMRSAPLRGFLPRVIDLQRDNRTSKQQRIQGLQPWFKSKSIRICDDIPCKTDLILEITRFPSASFHDDILDTLADQMQNAKGEINYDIVAEPFGQQIGQPRIEDRFTGFDPISKEARFLYDLMNQDLSSNYHAGTGM